MTSLFAIGFSIQEYAPILIIAFLLFGAKRLPELARSMGQGVKEFRKGIREVQEDIENDSEPSVDTAKTEATPKA